MTDASSGVIFDLRANDSPEIWSWTEIDSDDAFLALDRNANGIIDDGSELFGDVTPQPPTAEPQGYSALAVFDANGDRLITDADPIFPFLRLWVDNNHNGISELKELHSLSEKGIVGLSTDFRTHRRMDAHGNLFRYSAAVLHAAGYTVGPRSYDVFLVSGGTGTLNTAGESNLSKPFVPPSEGCPYWSATRGWPKGTPLNATIVRYRIDGFSNDAALIQKVKDAIGKWNAVSLNNGLSIYILPVESNQYPHLVIRTDDDSVAEDVAADMYGVPRSMSTASPVFITIYTRRRSKSKGFNWYNPTDPLTYGDAISKDILHELGHSFGLFDVGSSQDTETEGFCDFQRRGQSVMNSSACQNDNSNDVQNWQAASPSNCDQNGVRRAVGLQACWPQ